MKNLTKLYSEILNFNLPNVKFIILNQSENIQNEVNKKFFLITNLKIYECNNNILNELHAFSEIQSIRKVVSGEHLILYNQLCIAFESGEVILLNLQQLPAAKKDPFLFIEEITYCDGGIKEMKWSPDQEIVVFITKAKKLVTMTSTFDPICEAELDDFSSFGDGKFITLGWGKRETQFHGTAGKIAAAQSTAFEIPKNLDALPQDIAISWRGDGKFFVASFVGQYGRMFKVFDREGILQYTSEKVNDLGHCIAWRPSGSWIAVPRRLVCNTYTINLFEKNGLRHREIVLPFKIEDEEIYKLDWNNDSDILAVLSKSKEKTYLYLYITANYHWYLKDFYEYSSKVVDLKWGANSGKSLYILFSNGQYHFHKYSFTVTTNHINSTQNHAVVAVSDGKSVLLTDFRNKIVPPPMFSYAIKSSSYIVECGFIKFSNTEENINNFFTIDSKYIISFYQLIFDKIGVSSNFTEAKLIQEFCIYDKPYILTYNWIWLTANIMVFVLVNTNKNNHLCLLDISKKSVVDKIDLKDSFGNVTELNSEQIFVNLIKGGLQKISILNGDKFGIEGIIMSETQQFYDKISVHPNGDLVALMQTNGNLYVNGINIAQDVTSFSFTNNYVVFTQINSLKFYRVKDSQICDERKIERGGKLITIVPHNSKTILQMPRGNLEAINPRILSLELIGHLLDQLEYAKAMTLVLRERINLNILFDHNPDTFLKNINKFLDEISSTHWLNLFFSDLQNEDFSKTMYSSNYTNNSNYPEDYTPENKTVYICEKLCESMKKKNFQHYLLPIITTYVKCNKLELALKLIWLEKEKESKKPNQMEIESANVEEKSRSEEALKYLLYMVDVNKLYNIALGMYNFGLVMFVANKSQKDPKEYVPFLNELRKYEENYRNYKIDIYLKRYEKALDHIGACTDEVFDEIIPFITDQKVYQKALIVFGHSEERYKKIAILFADHLRSQSKFENASIMYERGNDLNQAILSAKHVLDWRRCLMLTDAANPDNKELELEKCCLSLVNALEEHGKYDDAFDMLKMFTNCYEQALMSLLKGKKYLRAIFEAKFLLPDFTHSILTPDLKLYAEILQKLIATDKDLYIKYKNRLETIRKNKFNEEHEIEDDIDECDILSDTTSIGSSSRFTNSSKRSVKSSRSSKNRRKHERKLLSLKIGNQFEDIAIIDYLHNHILKIMNQQESVRDICKALLEIRCDATAQNIQWLFKSLVEIIKKSLDEIWIHDLDMGQLQNKNVTDYALFQNQQRYQLLNPLKRIKPQLTLINWEHEILN